MQIGITDRATLTALLDASRKFSEALEAVLNDQGANRSVAVAAAGETAIATRRRKQGGLPAWDPLRDTPLVAPKVKGTRLEQDWCSLVYLGAIWAINVREGRGADRDEIREYAVKAGYRDGRAVTAWSKGNGATRNDDQKGRWITDAGKRAVLDYAAGCRVRLPADLVTEATGETD